MNPRYKITRLRTKALRHSTRQLHFDVKIFLPVRDGVAHKFDVEKESPVAMRQNHFEQQFATIGFSQSVI